MSATSTTTSVDPRASGMTSGSDGTGTNYQSLSANDCQKDEKGLLLLKFGLMLQQLI